MKNPQTIIAEWAGWQWDEIYESWRAPNNRLSTSGPPAYEEDYTALMELLYMLKANNLDLYTIFLNLAINAANNEEDLLMMSSHDRARLLAVAIESYKE